MKFKHSKSAFRIAAVCVSFVILATSMFPSFATKTAEELEAELSGLNDELEILNKELDHILSEIESTSAELKNTQEELAIAKGLEEAQYESMKLRIKYMYENGNFNMLEMLFSATCMADFLNRAEFYSSINEYDRELLNEFAENSKSIAEKEAALIADQEYLNSLQEELDEKEKVLNNKISSTSEDLSEHIAKLEKARKEAQRAEEEAKKQIEPVIPQDQKPSSGNSYETTWTDAISFTEGDVELLAALIECEAGSRNYEGMLAVGSVVVNRMKSRHYPDTLRGVVYQSGQFTPAHDGKLDKVLNRGVKSSCVTVAQDALNGKNNVGDCLSFRAASSGRPGTIIGDNVFF